MFHVCAEFVQGLHRIHRIALGFGHLLAVFILYMAQNDDIFIGSPVEQQGRLRQQGIEPASGLIHRLGDELGREFLFKKLLVFKGIMMLCKGHRAGIKPAVDDLRHSVHGLSALGTGDLHLVDVGAVQLDAVSLVALVSRCLKACQHLLIVGAHILKLLPASDAVTLSALALPYGKRGSPVTVSGEGPVLYVLQPIAETALADAFRDPVDGVVVADQIVPDVRHLDEPGLSGVVDQGRAAAPAMGIAVLELRRVEKLSSLVQPF